MALRSKLTSEQQRVVAAIRAGARRNRATPKEVKAAIETGLVESNLQNLSGGDADSAGWRQERASLYKDPTNLRASVDRFFQETKAVRGKYGTAGALAAAVQRPRADLRGRYQEVSGEAEKLLGASGGAGAPVAADAAQAAPGVEPEPATAVAPASILPQVQSQGIAAPSFSAQVRLPQGAPAGVPSSGPPVSFAQRIAATQLAVPEPEPEEPDVTGPTGAVADAVAGRPTTHRKGRVVLAPGADRAGVKTQPGVLKVVQAIADRAGRKLVIGTGTNHSQMTSSGNISDHWTGNGADIPDSGDSLTRLGQDALIAAGMPVKEARQAKGGIYNLPYGRKRRIQIIFNTTEGGNHWNHLHVGVTSNG